MKRKGDKFGFLAKRLALISPPQRDLLEQQGWAIWPKEEWWKPRGSGMFHVKCWVRADLVRYEHPTPHWPPFEVTKLSIQSFHGLLWTLLDIELDREDLLDRAENSIRDNHWPDFDNVKIKFRFQFLPRTISTAPWRWAYVPDIGFGRYFETKRFLELSPNGRGKKVKLGNEDIIVLGDLKKYRVPRIQFFIRYLAIVGDCNREVLDAFFFTWANTHKDWKATFVSWRLPPHHYMRRNGVIEAAYDPLAFE